MYTPTRWASLAAMSAVESATSAMSSDNRRGRPYMVASLLTVQVIQSWRARDLSSFPIRYHLSHARRGQRWRRELVMMLGNAR